MRKKIKIRFILSVICLWLCAVLCMACATDKPESETPSETITFTVTFRQDGFADIQKTVIQGEDLKDIPTPIAVVGYTIVWDKTDFANITQDMLVNAVKSANTYTITYDLGVNEYATLSSATQQVKFGEKFELSIPEYAGTAKFEGWYLADSNGNMTDEQVEKGNYIWGKDITVIAKWSEWSPVVS